jgi:hypothetical protein
VLVTGQEKVPVLVSGRVHSLGESAVVPCHMVTVTCNIQTAHLLINPLHTPCQTSAQTL